MSHAAKIFRALGDETRLKIVEFLMGGEKCVCEIFPRVGRKQSTVSIQLSKLESAGLVASRREGKKIYYKLSNNSLRNILKLAR